MDRRIVVSLALLAALALPVPASAGWGIVDLEVGAKGVAGANIWTDPTDLPAYLGGQDWAFDKLRAGWGAGAGVYAQLRLFKYLGLEMDVLFEQSQLQETPLDGQTWLLVARAVNARIPILVQAILPLQYVRIGLGLGPEFVVPIKTKAIQQNPIPGNNYDFKIADTTATMLTVGINITPVIAGHVTIPIDLRASYNLTQAKDYEGRVTVHTRNSGVPRVDEGFTLKLENTWDFRLLLGVGYAF